MAEEYRLVAVAAIREVDRGPVGGEYRLAAGPEEEPPAPDATAPTVTNVTPPAGTAITRTTPVLVDVTDDGDGLLRALITAAFADGSWEVVHDGDAFAARYAAESTRTVVAGGFRLRIQRIGGWPSAPTLKLYAFDLAGNEA